MEKTKHLKPGKILRNTNADCTVDYQLESHQIARLCYETVSKFSECINKTSPKKWNQLTGSQRNSLAKFVYEHVYNGHTARRAHDDWLDDRIERGWTYGLDYDIDRKTDPDMVEYSALPIDDRIKDKLFADLIKALVDISGV